MKVMKKINDDELINNNNFMACLTVCLLRLEFGIGYITMKSLCA